MALNQNYYFLWFESFRLVNTSGHSDPIQLHLVPGQDIPKEIQAVCDVRSLNPFDLLTECSKNLFYDYPVSTKFLLKSKLTDREKKGTFFYTSYKWDPKEIVEPS